MHKNSFLEKFIQYLQSHKSLRYFVIIIFCFSLAIPGSYLGYSGAMRSVDQMFEDSAYQKECPIDNRIVIIPITEANADLLDGNSLNLTAASEIIQILNSDEQNRPAVIAFADVLRLTNSGPALRFINEAKAADNVVISVPLIFSNQFLVGDDSKATEPFSARITYNSTVADSDEILQGYNNLVYDTDGIVRSYLWNTNVNGKRVLSFAEACYDRFCEYNDISDDEKYVPKYSTDGFTLIPFASKPNGFNRIDAHTVLSGNSNSNSYAGKIIIIGTCDENLAHGYMTAISKNHTMSNCEIQANVVYNQLNERSVVQYPIQNQLIILTLVTWVMAILTMNTPFVYSFAYAVVSLIAAFYVSSLLWDKGYSIHPLYYLATMVVAVFLSILVHIEKMRATQESTNAILSNYIDKNVKTEVLKRTRESSDSSGKKKNVVVLFADIRNFTAISQNLGPDNIVKLLNDFLSTADKCVHKYSGTVDKFIGDCVMAFWEDKDGKGSVVDNACRAAVEIVNSLYTKEEEYYSVFGNEISFGIGIDYGEAIVGDIGSETRKDYTLIGNAVNFASRLEATAPKGTVLISQSIYSRIKDYADCEIFEEKLLVRGYSKPMPAYALNAIGEKGPEINFERAYKLHDASVYTFYLFGTRGSFPVTGRRYSEFGGSTTCFVLKKDQHAIVFDCGTGLFEAQRVLSDCSKIDVVLSHVHYDHCIGLLSWFSVFPKNAELNFYGNFDGWFGEDTLSELFKAPFWPVDFVKERKDIFHSCRDQNIFSFDDNILVEFFDSPHPNEAKIMHIKAGNNRICLMVDCEKSNGIPLDIVKNCDLLVYDGMYDDSEIKGKEGWGHSTWQEAVRLAKNAQVKHLVIAHHNPESWDSVLRAREKEAKKIFPNTAFARSGSKINFPAE